MIRTNQVRALVVAVVFGFGGAETLFGQATTGDLDGNHEVSLSDVSDFVGCLTGPNDPSNDPLCMAGFFDDDNDVDLRDVAAFQNRFGFGVGPPRIDLFWPTPGMWIVDDIGLTHVQVGFTEPVVVPNDAVRVWVVSRLGIDGGDVTGFATDYDTEGFVLTVTFAEPLLEDRVTVILDYLIEDLAGSPLDGEIYQPSSAALPSGNGINGGQGVFRINVLQGDANRDGMTDASDLDLINGLLGLCTSDTGFDPNADLNSDGCIDSVDASIVSDAVGRQLPATDGSSPTIIDIRVSPVVFSVLQVTFSEVIATQQIEAHSCFLIDSNGTVVVPAVVGTSAFGTSAVYTLPSEFPACSGYSINISNAIADFSGELLPSPVEENCP
ncbi:MAG: hypothetical protein A49_11400 [Methyloceanibacter sp.]|nr:MAG: hypothetical protein A49_11400 [Methyloceanibacter sp.]